MTIATNDKFMKKNEPVYEVMRLHARYFLIMTGIYFAALIPISIAGGFGYPLLLGGVYGTVISVLNFLLLGKSSQAAAKKSTEKSAQTYMSLMYCVRYLGLFAALTLGALAPFINLVAAVIPLFFPKIAIVIRAIIKKEE